MRHAQIQKGVIVMENLLDELSDINLNTLDKEQKKALVDIGNLCIKLLTRIGHEDKIPHKK